MSTSQAFRLPWLLLLCLSFASTSPTLQADGEPGRIIAIGDVHGNLQALRSLLQKVDLIDSSDRWAGTDTALVILGDFTDRGAEVRSTMDFLMRLQEEARESGDRVLVLLGNHEVMNLTGDLRYVTESIYSTFADEESEKRREETYRDYLEWSRQQATLQNRPVPRHSEQLQQEFEQNHPLGYFEYVEALGPDGQYGKWLRQLPSVTQIGETLFAHGGIHPDLLEYDLDGLNDKIRDELEEFDRSTDILEREGVIRPYFNLRELLASMRTHVDLLSGDRWRRSSNWNRREVEQISEAIRRLYGIRDWLSFSEDGPLWYRGYASWTTPDETAKLDAILQRYDALRFVVGHTIVSEKEIVRRFEGKLFLIDTLIPSALVLERTRIIAVSQQGERYYSTSR